MAGVLNGIVTAIALLTFLGIVIWAYSHGRTKANQEAAMLPFALPDEAGTTKAEGDRSVVRGPQGELHE